MKKIFKKQNVMPVAVLFSICLVVALLLAVINMFTAPVIEEAENSAITESLRKVMPNGSFNAEPDELRDGAPETVKAVYTDKNGGGKVVVLVTNKGYTGKEIGITVAIDNDGKIIKAQITKNDESIVPSNMKPGGDYGENYEGADYDSITDVVTGATVVYSEGAIKNALRDAIAYITNVETTETLPKTDEEIIALAEALLGVESGALTDVTPEGLKDVKRVYVDNSGKNYAAYTVIMSQYGYVETETLVHIDSSGTVKKVNKLHWQTSPEMYGYVPPKDDVVNEFYDRLNGTNSDTIGSVDLVTNATNTSTGLVNALKEAIETVKTLVKESMPTEESEVIALAEALLGAEAGTLTDVTPENGSFVKLVYRDESKNNYAVYIVVINERYGRVESEALVCVGKDGKINAIKKMTWKTSDAGWGYEPPAEEEADAFYDRLVGATVNTIDSVDMVSGATSTSTGLVNALKEAMSTVTTLVWKDTPTPENEIIAKAEALLGAEAGTLTDVTPKGSNFVKRIYLSEEKGYAVYTVVINERYNRVETETIVYIDFDGMIKGIEKLTWKTSDAGWGYEPPAEEEADAFFARLVGASKESIDSVDMVTNATSTSTGLVDAIKEAFDLVDEMNDESELLRVIAVIVLCAAVIGFITYLVTPKIIEISKRRKNG